MNNILLPEDIEWKFICSLGLGNEHCLKYRNEEYKIQWEQYTRKIDEFKFSSKPKNYYFIDELEDVEFTSLQSLCEAWNEMYDYDTMLPTKEIKYIKVVTNRECKKSPDNYSLKESVEILRNESK